MGEQIYLKVLSEHNTSCHGGEMDWTEYLPTADGPGKPLPVIDNPVVCKRGYHWTTEQGLMKTWARAPMRVYVAEPSPDVGKVGSDDEVVSSGGRLLCEYALPTWWGEAMQFIEGIAATPWFSRQGEPNPEWRLFTAPTLDAAGAAAGDAAWAAARDTAGDVAWAVARAAARAAAGAAARDAARAAAGAAAWDAAWAAARAAARDAQLYVITHHICAGLDLDIAHIDHARARWEVWRTGYGLYGDVNGVLYVYEAVS